MKQRAICLLVLTLGTLVPTLGRSFSISQDLEGDSIRANKPIKAIRYGGQLGTGYAFGTGDYGDNRFSIVMIHGLVLHERLHVGAGFGIHVFDQILDPLMTLYGSLAWRITSTKWAPILGVDIGHSFYDKSNGAFSELYAAGLFLRPSLGLGLRISPVNDLRLSITYESQDARFTHEFDHEPEIPYYYYSSGNIGLWNYADEKQTIRRSNAIGINLQLTF